MLQDTRGFRPTPGRPPHAIQEGDVSMSDATTSTVKALIDLSKRIAVDGDELDEEELLAENIALRAVFTLLVGMGGSEDTDQVLSALRGELRLLIEARPLIERLGDSAEFADAIVSFLNGILTILSESDDGSLPF